MAVAAGSAVPPYLCPVGSGGYTGGEYWPVVELQLAGGDFLSDVSIRSNTGASGIHPRRENTHDPLRATTCSCHLPSGPKTPRAARSVPSHRPATTVRTAYLAHLPGT
jgi:hypothetical protein